MNIFRKFLNTKRYPVSYSHVRRVLHKVSVNRNVPIDQCSSSCYQNQVLTYKDNVIPYVCPHRNTSSSTDNTLDDIIDFPGLYQHDDFQSLRNLLFPNSKDPFINNLNDCHSIQDVFDFIEAHSTDMKHEHVAQAVLVLWDLQKIFLYSHKIDSALQSHITIGEYSSQLLTHPALIKLLGLVEANHRDFSTEVASCVLLYLKKLGLNIEHNVLQLLIGKLSRALGGDISLSALSRFTVAVCSEYSLARYFILQDSIPIIERELEKCADVEDLKLLTISLYHLNHIVSDGLIEKYKGKVEEFLSDVNKLNSGEHRALLKVIMLLSLPRLWKKHSILVSDIMMLLKNHLHLLSIPDFLIAYEVLYKTHEPGELLTEMQRCASRLLRQLEDESPLLTETKLGLLSATVCFSSPMHRIEYEKTMRGFLGKPLTKVSIFYLLKIAIFIKPSNTELCQQLWDSILTSLHQNEMFEEVDAVLHLSQKYINYYVDVHYRHSKFELEIVQWLSEQFKNGIIGLIPSQTSLAAAFILSFSNDQNLIDYVTNKIAENWEQFNHADCLYISKGLKISSDINSYVNTNQISKIKNAIDKVIHTKLLPMGDSTNISFLLKSYIYRKESDRKVFNELLLMTDPNQMISSSVIRNATFVLQSTDSLVPEIIDSMASYAIEHRDNLLGFNAERIIYLCYYLGYLPRRLDELCQSVSDLIIRDQERLSGLSYIQTALALCFFYKLPDSLMKHIFNVSFLEKVDAELSTCYFKDIYPERVRHNFMQLNRAVCLDYPQANIPWFHQKYIEQIPKRFSRPQNKDNTLAAVRTYLLKIVDDADCLKQDVKTAYGYYINYLIHLDNDGNIMKPTDDDSGIRVAILVIKSNAYTHINIQLKGQQQLKKRHLEILGYKVVIIDFNEWNSMIYGEEKMQYLLKSIWPDRFPVKSQFVAER